MQTEALLIKENDQVDMFQYFVNDRALGWDIKGGYYLGTN